MDVVMLRARVGMVFQKPNPFPKSVYDNVAYGPRIHGLARDRGELDEIVQTSLERAGLWTEVKDRLEEPGTGLSGGQQQRLCIARTIAVNPGRHPHGRAVLGARPDRDGAYRGPDRRAEAELRDRDRHALDAAGRARLAAHGVLPPRQADRSRRHGRHLHESAPQAHRRLHHGPLRLAPGAGASFAAFNAGRGCERGHCPRYRPSGLTFAAPFPNARALRAIRSAAAVRIARAIRKNPRAAMPA